MTVYVVICAEPSSAFCWTHGVYATKAQAVRVRRQLLVDTTSTVRLSKNRVQPAPAPRIRGRKR